MGVRNLWLVHPSTAEHLTLSLDEEAHGGNAVVELRRDARYLGGPVAEDLHRGGAAALAVREDEALARGFVRIPFSQIGTPACLRLISPWREWSALEKDPGSLPQHWAQWGAPLTLVQRLLPHVERGECHLEHCVVVFSGERLLVCSRPLHPHLASRIPGSLRALLSAHGHLEFDDFEGGLVAGWDALGPEQREDLLEHAPFDARSFVFLANETSHGLTWWVTPQSGLFSYTMYGVTHLTEEPATLLLREFLRLVENRAA